ncbi:MAG: RcnB family protein [Rhodocyclales bacterium]|nr:RcnB family protein [Rhodocyclales bacterium]
MKLISLASKCALALIMAGVLTASPAMADKGGSSKGNNKDGKHDRGDQRDERRDDDRHSSGNKRHFEERQHVMVREYYVEHYRDARRCPPGLAKKHNGCMPPGQAKKWKVGRPLPREVIYYEVPQPLVVQIGLPPAGHRYVRVAGDILLIAIGTGMVVDAINDLGGM